MSVFTSQSFDGHELVTFSEDASTGLRAIIAIHNSSLGPAFGGCRMYPYANDDEALDDVLRLSRGMTYKNSLAGLPMGGGKAVIIGDPKTLKTPELMQSMGRFVETLGGRYVTAEDSGTCVADMKEIGKMTKHVTGLNEGQQYGGDPSPFTALGIYVGIKAAVKYKLGAHDLQGKSVAVQGAGAVGRRLIALLISAGAKVFVSDVNQTNLALAAKLGAVSVNTNDILQLDVDVLAPCAMGAVINNDTIEAINASIIAGGANNQLHSSEHADALLSQDILYAPDFVINAGGIIDIWVPSVRVANKSKK